jgi:hypothetical protein
LLGVVQKSWLGKVNTRRDSEVDDDGLLATKFVLHYRQMVREVDDPRVRDEIVDGPRPKSKGRDSRRPKDKRERSMATNRSS